MNTLTQIMRSFQNYLTKQTMDFLPQVNLFAWVMLINFPLFGVLWAIESPLLIDEFVLRVFATILSCLLVSSRWWTIYWVTKYLPWLWYLTLLFCLPFFFCYVTLLHHGATLWLMNCVSAVFFLLLLVRVVDSLILLSMGSLMAYASYLYQHALYYAPGELSILGLSVTFTAVIIIGALFARDRELMQANRIVDMQLLAGGLAHDLRTSFAGIHLQTDLQALLIEKLNNPDLQLDLKQSINKIIRGIEMGNQLITMQLNNIQREKFDTGLFEIHSISALLDKTMQDYPYREGERALIHRRLTIDFSVWIEEIAFKNLVWNLLKNSLDYIDEIGKGEISIWATEGGVKDNFNYLNIKDTAKGLYPKSTEKIFESFYTERKGGTGVGLSYCKLLMKAAGGDIVCKGKLNNYAHFIIKFPKID
jgi:signal transduction histidine kinase